MSPLRGVFTLGFPPVVTPMVRGRGMNRSSKVAFAGVDLGAGALVLAMAKSRAYPTCMIRDAVREGMLTVT